MQLELTRYRQPLNHFARTFQPEEVAQPGDSYLIVAPVGLEFDLHKDKDKFRLEGTVRAELELQCSRCLEPFRMPVATQFDLRSLPASAMSTDAETPIGEEDASSSTWRCR